MIGRDFTLETDLFEAKTAKPSFVNPNCFGEDFAEWLRARLVAHGIEPSPPIAEDWGWVMIVPYSGLRFTLSIAVMDESIGQIPADWRVGVSYEKGLNGLRAWFRAAPEADLEELAKHLREVLEAEPRIRNLANT